MKGYHVGFLLFIAAGALAVYTIYNPGWWALKSLIALVSLIVGWILMGELVHEGNGYPIREDQLVPGEQYTITHRFPENKYEYLIMGEQSDWQMYCTFNRTLPDDLYCFEVEKDTDGKIKLIDSKDRSQVPLPQEQNA